MNLRVYQDEQKKFVVELGESHVYKDIRHVVYEKDTIKISAGGECIFASIGEAIDIRGDLINDKRLGKPIEIAVLEAKIDGIEKIHEMTNANHAMQISMLSSSIGLSPSVPEGHWSCPKCNLLKERAKVWHRGDYIECDRCGTVFAIIDDGSQL